MSLSTSCASRRPCLASLEHSRFPGAARAAILGLVALPLFAATAAAEPTKLTLELNKLEPQGESCRAYVVLNNESANDYQAMKTNLVVFGPDGVISRWFTVDFAPLPASKRKAKPFDFTDLSCDKIGSILINEVSECKTAAGPVDDCLSGMTVKSLSNVQITK